MASIENFNDHCWKDVIPEADLKLYTNWRRDTFVGPRPALLAIDLYDLVYRSEGIVEEKLTAEDEGVLHRFLAHRELVGASR